MIPEQVNKKLYLNVSLLLGLIDDFDTTLEDKLKSLKALYVKKACKNKNRVIKR